MAGPMPYREEGAPAPFTFKDPSAPTLEEATLALAAANDFRAKWLTERKIALAMTAKWKALEAEMACALETADEGEREATWHMETAA